MVVPTCFLTRSTGGDGPATVGAVNFWRKTALMARTVLGDQTNKMVAQVTPLNSFDKIELSS